MKLEKILSGFTKTLTQLDTFIQRQGTAIGFAEDDADNAQIRVKTLKQEQSRAKAIQANLTKLLS